MFWMLQFFFSKEFVNVLAVFLAVVYFYLEEWDDLYRKTLHYVPAHFRAHTASKVESCLFLVLRKHGHVDRSLAHVRRHFASSYGDK